MMLCCNAELIAVQSETPTAQNREQQHSESLVYFVGSVERVVSGRAIVDLGEVHSLREGLTVTAFRTRDNQFQPLGTMKVAESFPNWMAADRVSDFQPDVGDIIVYVRSVAELGTAAVMRDRYLADQYISNRDRNGYSTFRTAHAARTLLTLQESQPKWVETRRPVAGQIFGQNFGPVPPGSLQRLLSQINLFRQLEADGLPVAEAAGERWEAVMPQLMTRQPSAVATESDEDPSLTEASAMPIAIPDIQRAVDRRLYYRNQEEQFLASAMTMCVLRLNPRNETVWLRQHLARSQFPLLATDEQFLVDVAYVLRQLREQSL